MFFHFIRLLSFSFHREDFQYEIGLYLQKNLFSFPLTRLFSENWILFFIQDCFSGICIEEIPYLKFPFWSWFINLLMSYI